jgi:pentatricopeptide repeat protein
MVADGCYQSDFSIEMERGMKTRLDLAEEPPKNIEEVEDTCRGLPGNILQSEPARILNKKFRRRKDFPTLFLLTVCTILSMLEPSSHYASALQASIYHLPSFTSQGATHLPTILNEQSSNTQVNGVSKNSEKLLSDLSNAQSSIRTWMGAPNPDWSITLQLARNMMYWVEQNESFNKNIQLEASLIIDDTFRYITEAAFLSKGENAWDGVKVGLKIMEIQGMTGIIYRTSTEEKMRLKSKHAIQSPFDTVTSSTCSRAIKALHNLSRNVTPSSLSQRSLFANAAYRILQRLCTEKGIRLTAPNIQPQLDERDFNRILDLFVNIGNMQMTHRVVALQERTPHAPPLSGVTYSILLKGYGRLQDIDAVERVLQETKYVDLDWDIVLHNSLIDAYVNCGQVEKAYSAFKLVRSQSMEVNDDVVSPNIRTYNIMLKGFRHTLDLDKAIKLAKEMERAGLWDKITTNTLVGVAVASHDFDLAEQILLGKTVSQKTSHKRRGRHHPNVEAYTELLDGYAKNGKLGKAIETLKHMRERGVKPNDYTYSCIIGAFARFQNIQQAVNMLEFMEQTDDIVPSIVTFNALYSGLFTKISDENMNSRVDRGLEIFEEMLTKRLHPNDVTLSVFVEAFGRCDPPRIKEANSFVRKFDDEGFVPLCNVKVVTALMRACSYDLDIEGVLSAYSKIENPDTISFNVLIDSCCRCGKPKLALKLMEENKAKSQSRTTQDKMVDPDVTTFSTLIATLLKVGNSAASSRVQLLYTDMKQFWGIKPDRGLVDL